MSAAAVDTRAKRFDIVVPVGYEKTVNFALWDKLVLAAGDVDLLASIAKDLDDWDDWTVLVDGTDIGATAVDSTVSTTFPVYEHGHHDWALIGSVAGIPVPLLEGKLLAHASGGGTVEASGSVTVNLEADTTVNVVHVGGGGGTGGGGPVAALLVSILDADGNFTATTVEGALAELAERPVILDAADVGADPAGTAAALVAGEVTNRNSAISSALAAHVAATDPHPQYLTAAEAGAAYEALGAVAAEATARAAAISSEATARSNADAAEALARDAAIATAIADLIASAPGALDTLKELADAIGDDPNYAATVTNLIAGRQPLDSDLTAIAALATTAYGRSFLTLVDAAAARTALALGSAATAETGDFDIAGAAVAAIAAHVADSDPHPQYVSQTELDAELGDPTALLNGNPNLDARITTVENEVADLPLVEPGLQTSAVIDETTGNLVVGHTYTKTPYDPSTDNGLQLTVANEYVAVVGAAGGAYTALYLPAAAEVPPGFPIDIHDEGGLLSDAHVLVIAAKPTSGDTVSPANFLGGYAMTATKGTIRFRSNGTDQWDLVATSVATAAGFALDLATESLLYSLSLDKFASAKADVNLGGHRVLNVGAPLLPGDAVNRDYVEGYTVGPDSAYTIAETDRRIVVPTLTATRAYTLPKASRVGKGATIRIEDHSGNNEPDGTYSTQKYVAVVAQSGDTISPSVVGTGAIMNHWGASEFVSDGVSGWHWTSYEVTQSRALRLNAAGSPSTHTYVSSAAVRELDGIRFVDGTADVTMVSGTALVATDRRLVFTGLTAQRTVTLPALSSVWDGYEVTIQDGSGLCNLSRAIVIVRGGTDTIDGGDFGNTTVYLATPRGEVTLRADRTHSKWYPVAPSMVRGQNLADVLSAPTSRYNLHDQVLAACRAVATANVASLSGTTTIDGVSLSAGDYVLLVAQTTGSQNGPWVVAAGAWSRPSDYPAGGTVISRLCEVQAGSYAGSLWASTNATAVTVDTTSTTWVRIGGPMPAGWVGVADTAYSAASTDRVIVVTSLTASRNITLPAASSVPKGETIRIQDASGSITPTVGVTVLKNGSDTAMIGGVFNTVGIGGNYDCVIVRSDGAANWYVEQGPWTIQTLSNKRITKRLTTVTDGRVASWTPTGDASDIYRVGTSNNIDRNFTINAPSGTPAEGDRLVLKFKSDATPRTITWNAIYVVQSGATALPTTTTASKWHRVEFEYDSIRAKWVALSVTVEA